MPFLFLLLQRLRGDRMRIGLLTALWLTALAIRLGIFYRHAGPWSDMELYGAVYFRTHTRFDPLVAGIILAVVHQRWGKDIAVWLKQPFHRALLALPALAGFWFLLRAPATLPEHAQVLRLFLWGTVTSVMYLCLVPLALYGEGWVVSFLSAPFFRRLATLGYGAVPPRAHPDHRPRHGPDGARGADAAMVDGPRVAGRAGVDVRALARGRVRAARADREAVSSGLRDKIAALWRSAPREHSRVERLSGQADGGHPRASSRPS